MPWQKSTGTVSRHASIRPPRRHLCEPRMACDGGAVTLTFSALLGLQVLLGMPGSIAKGEIPITDELCHEEGGQCLYTYRGGCDDPGSFTRGLCAGPMYRQCCILPVVEVDIEPIKPWRMCYSCDHSMSNGATRGSPECNDPFSGPDTLPIVNCTGHCSKQVLNLDKTSKSIRRLCAEDCRPVRMYDSATTHCCYDNLCNDAPSVQRDMTLMAACVTVLQLGLSWVL